MPTNFAKKKADRPERPEPDINPVEALRRAVGERSEELSLKDITIDETLQVRVKGIDPKHLQSLMAELEAGRDFSQSDPVVVFLTPDRKRLLADGFHRVEAYKQMGRHSIFAVVRQGTWADARLFAEGANLTHGLVIDDEDKKSILESRLIRQFYENEQGYLASDAVIADSLKISRPTAGTWIKEIATRKNLRVDLTIRVGADGKTRDMSASAEANQQRAEEERKRKEQERFDAQIAAEEEKLARFRASNVIFRAKFIADMLLHTPYNRNVAAKLKMDLLPENTPEAQKTFGYYVKAADKRFTMTTDREMQFIRDFKSNKGYHWYQDVLAAVTPAIWEQADAQNWTEEEMQAWLDGFKQRHSSPLPSAAPGMAQPKNPNIEIPQPKVLGRHYETPPAPAWKVGDIVMDEATAIVWRVRRADYDKDQRRYRYALEDEDGSPKDSQVWENDLRAPAESPTEPSLDDCPFEVGQNVEVFESGEKGVVQRVTYVNDEWRINVLLYDGVHVFKADELQRIFAEVIEEAIEATPTPVHDDPAPCPFSVGDRVIYRDGKHYEVLGAEQKDQGWKGFGWQLHVADENGRDFYDHISRFGLLAMVTVVEDRAVVPFRTGDILKDIQTGEYVEVVGFSSDGSITVQGEDGSEYPAQAGDFEKALHITPELWAQASSKPFDNGEYKPSNGTQTQMAENYMALMKLIQEATEGILALKKFDFNLQYLQTPETLAGIWDTLAVMRDQAMDTFAVVAERLNIMTDQGLPYDPTLAQETLNKRMQRA